MMRRRSAFFYGRSEDAEYQLLRFRLPFLLGGKCCLVRRPGNPISVFIPELTLFLREEPGLFSFPLCSFKE